MDSKIKKNIAAKVASLLVHKIRERGIILVNAQEIEDFTIQLLDSEADISEYIDNNLEDTQSFLNEYGQTIMNSVLHDLRLKEA